MTKTLTALRTRLSWQHQTLERQLKELNLQLHQLDQQITVNQGYIQDAQTLSVAIIPEQEMARLHYLIHHQRLDSQYQTQRNDLVDQREVVTSGLIRLNTELKQLDNYQHQQQQADHQRLVLQHQTQADEWAMQRINRQESHHE